MPSHNNQAIGYFPKLIFLLNNALRKLVLDNDVDTAVSLLKLADETLVKVNNSQANEIRSAINQDLKQLLSLSSVDQNAIMQNYHSLQTQSMNYRL